jgi:hypothetical protein
VVPGASPTPLPPRGTPRDSTIFRPPGRDSSVYRPPTVPRPGVITTSPPRDTSRVRVDSVKRGGVIIRRDSAPPRPDTTVRQQGGRRSP